MRPAFAVILAIFFAVIFIGALIVSRVVNTVGKPDEVAGLIESADLYDFLYDRVLDAALTDIVNRGVTFESGLNGRQTIRFNDPAQARAVLKEFIETILPREYVSQKVEELFEGVIPYASGRADSFTVDLETSERINSVPEAVLVASEEIGLGELLVTELIAPIVRDLSRSITDSAFGIELSGDEAVDAARRILPPEWIEDQLFAAVNELAPYLAGETDDVSVVIPLQERIRVAGEVLKEKLDDDDVVIGFVFEEVVDPLVGGVLDENNILVFGVNVTSDDIQEAVEIVAPDDWIRDQGDGVIDALVAWLTVESANLEYTIDLGQRKDEAFVELEALAFRKIDERVDATPVCTTAFEVGDAFDSAVRGEFPSCLPQNSSEVLNIMRPLLSLEMSSLVRDTVPDSITYSEQQLRAQLGNESIETLETLRQQVIGGIGFTDDDVVRQLAGSDDPQSLADARESLDIVRSGFVFDDTEITDRMDDGQISRFDNFRGWIRVGWTFRWVIFLPALALLALVAFTGGRNWPGRARWAGGSIAVVAILFFLGIQLGWASTSSLRDTEYPFEVIGDENRADFPALASLIDNGEVQNMAERVGKSWISGLAFSATPWAITGLLLLGISFYPSYRHHLPASLRGPGDRGPSQRKVIYREGSERDAVTAAHNAPNIDSPLEKDHEEPESAA